MLLVASSGILYCTGLGLVQLALPQTSVYLAVLILQQAVHLLWGAGAHIQMQACIKLW